MLHKTQLNITDDKTNRELWECQVTVLICKVCIFEDFDHFHKFCDTQNILLFEYLNMQNKEQRLL